MFTNNKFGKFDAVADAIKSIAEADYKAKMEELKGQQHKIDKNKNNKIDAHDFAILRGEKKGMKKEEAEQIDEISSTLANKYLNAPQGKGANKYKVGDTGTTKKNIYPDVETMSKHSKSVRQAIQRSGSSSIFKKPSYYKEEAENVEESNNPFDLKNYKSQLPTKPGEKAGFDSKKVSTGTIYSRKPVKDEPMKKEEIDPNDTTTDTLKGREKTSGNPFLSKKVKMDVPDNVKEEAEQIDELSKDTLKSYSAKAKASAKSHKDAGDQYDSDPDERAFAPKQYKKAASRTAGAAKADSRIKEEAEQIDELKKTTVKSYLAKKMASLPGKDPKKDQKDMMKAHHRVTGVKPTSEEVEQVDERTLTKGETKEKERIVKGMKKSLAGFKQRYGDKAKSVMYATATKAAKKD